MKKYICDLRNHGYLPNRNFKQVGDHILIELTDSQYQDCKLKIEINEEKVFKIGSILSDCGLLTLGGNYQKVISQWQKVRLQGFDGTGSTLGSMDTGNNNYFNHYTATSDEYYNYTDSTDADVFANQHGTQTSSIIKSPQIGMDNGCRMVSAKVFNDTGTITESWVLSAIAQFRASGVDFFSMSFQIGYSSAIATALLNARNAGTIPIASSGNSFTDSTTVFPASAPGVIAVNSVNKDNVAGHRSYLAPAGGHGVDISCNGVSSEIVFNGNVLAAGGGTSFCSPFKCAVTGVERQRLGITKISDNERVIEYLFLKALKHADPAVRRVLTY